MTPTDPPLVQIGRMDFRFECQPGCSACCEQPGEVYLTAADQQRIADHLHLSLELFRRDYCEPDDADDPRLSTPEDRACHFLEDGRCTIHEVKPVQCGTFPFWPEHVKRKSAWSRLSRYCPGIGEGPKIPREEVQNRVGECAAAFPDIVG